MTREDEIFRQIKQGKTEYLDELVRMYYPEIFRYCVWHTKSYANAEDAAQETFLKAVRHLDRYTHKGKFRAFLYQIAANTCIDMGRRKCEEPMDAEILEAFLEPGEYMDEVEQAVDFLSLVEHLPEDAKEIILLRFGQELKLREIAAVMGLPLRTVQSRLRAAVRLLRGLIAEQETDVKLNRGKETDVKPYRSKEADAKPYRSKEADAKPYKKKVTEGKRGGEIENQQ